MIPYQLAGLLTLFSDDVADRKCLTNWSNSHQAGVGRRQARQNHVQSIFTEINVSHGSTVTSCSATPPHSCAGTKIIYDVYGLAEGAEVSTCS